MLEANDYLNGSNVLPKPSCSTHPDDSPAKSSEQGIRTDPYSSFSSNDGSTLLNSYEVGKIVFVKYYNYPLWPAMIIYSNLKVPCTASASKYTSLEKYKSSNDRNKIHIVFLAENSHAWVSPKALFEFIDNDDSIKKKYNTIMAKFQNKWIKSVKLALEYTKLENYERIIKIRKDSKFVDNLFDKDQSSYLFISAEDNTYSNTSNSMSYDEHNTAIKNHERNKKKQKNSEININGEDINAPRYNKGPSKNHPIAGAYLSLDMIMAFSKTTKLLLVSEFNKITCHDQRCDIIDMANNNSQASIIQTDSKSLLEIPSQDYKQNIFCRSQSHNIDIQAKSRSSMDINDNQNKNSEDSIGVLPKPPMKQFTAKKHDIPIEWRSKADFDLIINLYGSYYKDSPSEKRYKHNRSCQNSTKNHTHTGNNDDSDNKMIIEDDKPVVFIKDDKSSSSSDSLTKSPIIGKKTHMFFMRNRSGSTIPTYSSSISMHYSPKNYSRSSKKLKQNSKTNISITKTTKNDFETKIEDSLPLPNQPDDKEDESETKSDQDRLIYIASPSHDSMQSQASILNYKSNPLGFKSMMQCMVSNYNVNFSAQICSFCFEEIDSSKNVIPPSSSNAADHGVISCKMCTYCWHNQCYNQMVSNFGHTSSKNNDVMMDDGICMLCISNKRRCIVCNVYDVGLLDCIKQTCQNYFHKHCIESYPLWTKTKDKYMCPHHYCLSCFKSNPENIKKQYNGQLLKCILCPLACHPSDFCIPAGSVRLGNTQFIMCHRHISAKLINQRVSANFCFSCTESDDLIKCSQCPTCFHPSCIGINKPYKELKLSNEHLKWKCEECENIKIVKFGQVVWTKFGNYPWWPGQVVHERYASEAIRNCPHSTGQFIVHFFGTNDFIWTHVGKIYLYTDGDEGEDTRMSKNLMMKFKEALLDADIAYQIYNSVVKSKEHNPMDTFKSIKTNQPVGSVIIKREKNSKIPICDCKPVEGACSNDSCINRRMKFECSSTMCPAKEFCGNRNFSLRNYKKFEIIKTNNCGFGLKTLEFIKEGDFVNEYVGELIDNKELERRQRFDHDNSINNFYYLTLDSTRTIDARLKSNLSRFINHSCSPNLVATKWMVNGDLRIGFFALHDIEPNTELSFNYNYTSVNPNYLPCLCKSPNCRQYFGSNKDLSVQKQKLN